MKISTTAVPGRGLSERDTGNDAAVDLEIQSVRHEIPGHRESYVVFSHYSICAEGGGNMFDLEPAPADEDFDGAEINALEAVPHVGGLTGDFVDTFAPADGVALAGRTAQVTGGAWWNVLVVEFGVGASVTGRDTNAELRTELVVRLAQGTTGAGVVEVVKTGLTRW